MEQPPFFDRLPARVCDPAQEVIAQRVEPRAAALNTCRQNSFCVGPGRKSKRRKPQILGNRARVRQGAMLSGINEQRAQQMLPLRASSAQTTKYDRMHPRVPRVATGQTTGERLPFQPAAIVQPPAASGQQPAASSQRRGARSNHEMNGMLEA